MSIKERSNYLIDWKTKKGYEDRKKYFLMLRAVLLDLDDLRDDRIDAILKKHNVYFMNNDEFPRVNIDIPEGKTQHGDR